MSPLSWETVLETNLLRRSHFCSATWNDKVIIHGGCAVTAADKGGPPPLDSVILLDPERGDVAAELVGRGPRLSHHAGDIVGDCLVLVGGWNGRNRTRQPGIDF